MSGPYRDSSFSDVDTVTLAVISDAKSLRQQLISSTEPVAIGDWLVKSAVVSAVRLQIADGGATVHLQVYWFPSGQRMTFTKRRDNSGAWSDWEQ